MSNTQIKADITPSEHRDFVFPETTPELLSRTNNCGICFSGGGTRSMAATMGQLRALHKLGLLAKARYISSVSGGSWAAAIYTYYKNESINDTELLGDSPNYVERNNWGKEEWAKSLKEHNLAKPATTDFLEVFTNYAIHHNTEMAWIYAVRDVYFKPFGLDQPNYFSLNTQSVNSVLEANQQLQPNWKSCMFDITRPDRPYLIVNGIIIWPAKKELFNNHLKVNRALIQFTPLYTGNPWALRLHENQELENVDSINTGGGFLSSYAFGSSGPNQPADDNLKMPIPKEPFSIWHASGISSSAFAYFVANGALSKTALENFVPQMDYWAVTDSNESQQMSQKHYFGDGGALDNNGLMAMLQRRVEKIVVFVNSSTPISKNKNKIIIDADIAPLFGIESEENLPNNTVFDASVYDDLVNGLWAAYKKNGLCMHRQEYITLENEWFGTPAYKLEILWVYNSPVEKWIQLLSTDMQHEIRKGIESSEGDLKHFPNYKTISEEFLKLVKLKDIQVACIADMFAWSIEDNADVFTALLGK
tara:strand:+ start:4098 stop:5699 length:1602 start_codon:yes stop_codon:yes gene_type:complete